jgi:hypothetical protein
MIYTLGIDVIRTLFSFHSPQATCNFEIMEPWIAHLHPEEYSPEEWEFRRPEIERFYIKEDRTLPELIKRMTAAGFHAT